MRIRNPAVRIGLRVIAVILIFLAMFVAIDYILATSSGGFGTPASGRGILLSLVVALAGIVGMLFACLYKSSWVDRQRE